PDQGNLSSHRRSRRGGGGERVDPDRPGRRPLGRAGHARGPAPRPRPGRRPLARRARRPEQPGDEPEGKRPRDGPGPRAGLGLGLIAETALATSLDVVEVKPVLYREKETGKLAVDLVASGLGARIL